MQKPYQYKLYLLLCKSQQSKYPLLTWKIINTSPTTRIWNFAITLSTSKKYSILKKKLFSFFYADAHRQTVFFFGSVLAKIIISFPVVHIKCRIEINQSQLSYLGKACRLHNYFMGRVTVVKLLEKAIPSSIHKNWKEREQNYGIFSSIIRHHFVYRCWIFFFSIFIK